MRDLISRQFTVSIIFLFVGVLYLIAEILNLVVTNTDMPLTAQLSVLIAGYSLNDNYLPRGALSILTIIISIAIWIIFLVLGTLGIYTRQVAKISSYICLQRMAKYGALLSTLLLIAQTPMIIIFANTITKDNVKVDGVLLPTIILQCVFALIQTGLFLYLFMAVNKCIVTMKVFHDYLINYKQTPRSRMFKRYRPPMEQIAEIDS